MTDPDTNDEHWTARPSSSTHPLPVTWSAVDGGADPLRLQTRGGESVAFRPGPPQHADAPIVLAADPKSVRRLDSVGPGLPSGRSLKLTRLAQRLEQQQSGVHIAFLRLAGARRPLVLVASDQSFAYRAGHRSWHGGKVWRDWFYAVAFHAFAGIDALWRSPVVEFVHPTSNGWKRDLAPSVLDGLAGLLADRPLLLREVAVHDCCIDRELTPVRDAIATITSEASVEPAAHRQVAVADVPAERFGTWEPRDEVRIVRVDVG